MYKLLLPLGIAAAVAGQPVIAIGASSSVAARPTMGRNRLSPLCNLRC